jgi:adenine-specific DNA-methyltransferase
MKRDGKLCYITPSSWLSSLAATNMRKYITVNRKLIGLIDLEHFQAFEGATTYTLISYFDNKNSNDNVAYYIYEEDKKEKRFVDNLTLREMMIGNDFYISSKSDLNLLRKIKQTHYTKLCTVKNGFATLADQVFIGNLPFNTFTIPILKASTGKWTKGFFPYDKNGKPIKKETIFGNEDVASYLNSCKVNLLKGKDERNKKDWYLYGRTQALKDVEADKIAINTIIKNIDSIKLNHVPAGTGLYSGLYILTKAPFSDIESAIRSQEFVNYIKTLKKYKSGGYYTFNSKDLEHYLNFKLSENVEASNFVSFDEHRISQGNHKLF